MTNFEKRVREELEKALHKQLDRCIQATVDNMQVKLVKEAKITINSTDIRDQALSSIKKILSEEIPKKKEKPKMYYGGINGSLWFEKEGYNHHDAETRKGLGIE